MAALVVGLKVNDPTKSTHPAVGGSPLSTSTTAASTATTLGNVDVKTIAGVTSASPGTVNPIATATTLTAASTTSGETVDGHRANPKLTEPLPLKFNRFLEWSQKNGAVVCVCVCACVSNPLSVLICVVCAFNSFRNYVWFSTRTTIAALKPPVNTTHQPTPYNSNVLIITPPVCCVLCCVVCCGRTRENG